MSNTLEERLKTHSSAFDGLLSLIPAKYYYDDATQDQWQQKKKSKSELRQNKRAKLDPNSKETADMYNSNGASAKDVLENRAKNAKPVVLPGEKAKFDKGKHVKSVEEEADQEETVEAEQQEPPQEAEDLDIPENISSIFDDEGNEIATDDSEEKASSSNKKNKKKAELTPEDQQRKEENLRKLREKLAGKITVLKQKRKALGTNVEGAPKSREQILTERRQKEEQRKLKRKRDTEEADEEEESNSDSDSDSDNEEDEMSAKDVLFQNIVFADGDRVTSDLTHLRKQPKKKGPSNKDIKGHLSKLEQKKLKLQDMDEDKRKKVQEKEKWQRVMAQAEGIKVKDDEKLLKKALKRKDQQKRKSEVAWQERKDTVEASIQARTKRREENLQLRKENKGKKSKHQQKMKKKFTGIVKPKRAGFEGRLKSGNKKNDK